MKRLLSLLILSIFLSFTLLWALGVFISMELNWIIQVEPRHRLVFVIFWVLLSFPLTLAMIEFLLGNAERRPG